jgi:hypothetical protein
MRRKRDPFRSVLPRVQTPLRAITLAVALATGAPGAFALSLGSPEVASFLGQPLLLRVPVILDDPGEGSTQCPRIVGAAGSDVPTLVMGRLDLERGVTQTWLRISTTLPVDEPVLRVVLEIGCTQRVRREFTLLLDPPAGLAAAPTPVAPSPAPLIEFGRPVVVGTRGQPLLMTLPIYGEQASTLAAECVHAGLSDGNELPRIVSDARVSFIEDGAARALRIHTPEPVNDARVRVLVELGCQRPLRQEFVVSLDEPRLAATEQVEPPAAKPAPVKRTEKPVARAPQPAKVALPPPAKPGFTLETPAGQRKPDAADSEGTRIVPAESKAKPDRLVLRAPDEAIRPGPPRAEQPEPKAETPRTQAAEQKEGAPLVDATAEEREQVIKRLEVLAAEVKTLRAELDASAARNRELSERARSAGYAWAAAAVAALLLGLGVLIHWRTRPRRDEPAVDMDKAGPLTRILGKSSEYVPPLAPVVPPPAMTDGAGPNTVAAIVAAHKAAHEQDTQGASTAIMVTEFRDTTQVIGELYSPYVEQDRALAQDQEAAHAARNPGPSTQPAPNTVPAASTLDLGNERTTVLAPHTKTEIAVDIDLSERNTEITRELRREYERLDLAAREKEGEPKESELPTRMGDTTAPVTTKLALDLDLDISTITNAKLPKKDS